MRPVYRCEQSRASSRIACDILSFALAALYAWLAFRGSLILSADGAILDSDLQTYAQGMAGAAHPEQFATDPVLAKSGQANSIPNLQRWLAGLFLKNDNYGAALLKSGACAIFLFFSCWYILGRYLFRSPATAALMALCSGITIWIGWGTFWGVTHSDPVPRVFFAAVFPLLLLAASVAFHKISLRPPVMLFTGACMWIHGVSALNCGAMFLCAFFFCKPDRTGLKSHLAIFALSGICFLLPVCLFLWPSIGQGKSFDAEALALFREMLQIRWQADFTGFWPRMGAFFSPSAPPFFLTLAGLASWILLYGKKLSHFYPLWKMTPFFILAILAVAFFSWIESQWAEKLGRLTMGHELVRGMRFFIPLAWLSIIAGCAVFSGKWTRRIALILTLCILALFNRDRQHLAVETAIAEFSGLQPPESALLEIRNASALKEMLLDVRKTVPAGEAIFCPEDQMPLRYVARLPLAHSFKDGYVFFYDKDLEASKKWLDLEKTLKNDGLAAAWRLSGAPWLLVRKGNPENLPDLKPDLQKNGWLLFRRPPEAAN